MKNKLVKKYELITKIDEYSKDRKAAGEILPFGKMGMRMAAILDYIFYGTSFSEYFAYRFYALNRKEKKTFMTRRFMFKFFDKYNPPSLRDRIGDKRLTKQYYGELMKRDQFTYEKGFEEFCIFAQNHHKLFIKRAISWGGMGAYVADVSSPDKYRGVWDKLNQDCVIEECIENCEMIKRIHPQSLNTIKVLTLNLKDGPEIQTALFRMGNNTVVDNVHLGGICAVVDISSGVVISKAIDNHFREYTHHPITGYQIIGLCIPRWEEVKQLALRAASITPGLRYASWDIAVTESGPILIEGNWDAEFYAEQMISQKGNRIRFCNKLEEKIDS